MFARLFLFTAGYLTGALCVASMVAGRILPRVLPTCLEHCVSYWGCTCSAGNVGSWVVRAEPGQGHGCLLGAWFLLLSWRPVTDLFPGPLPRGAEYVSWKMRDSGLFLSLPMPLVLSGILFLRRSFCFWVTMSFYIPSRLPSSLEPVSRNVQRCAGFSWLSSFLRIAHGSGVGSGALLCH